VFGSRVLETSTGSSSQTVAWSLPADNMRGNDAINHAAVERLQVSSYRVTLTSASRKRKVMGTSASSEI